MDADGGLRVALVGSHLIQHLKDGRDGLRHAVIRPRDVMQLFQGPATLGGGWGGEMHAVLTAETLSKTSDTVVMSRIPFLMLMLWKVISRLSREG